MKRLGRCRASYPRSECGWRLFRDFRLAFARKLAQQAAAVALAKGRGFSTDQYGGTVSVFELSTLQPVKRISVGDYPEGIETSADGNNVYVVNWFSNEVWTSNMPTWFCWC